MLPVDIAAAILILDLAAILAVLIARWDWKGDVSLG